MDAIEIFNTKEKNFLEDLFNLLRIPSISRDKNNVRRAANWLKKRLKQTADHVELVETTGNPAILAQWSPQINQELDKEKPTILFYGHYDVQSPDPLDQWISPPFEPEIRDGRIYARGVGDNKGQLFANLCAIECVHECEQLGLRVKFIFDGEEELGSPYLNEALKAKKDFFRGIDLVIVSDGPAHSSWQPTIEFGVRGIVTATLELCTATSDMHSGNFGGIQPNPVWGLISILQTMRDEEGKCLIEGFYDDVFTPEPAALEAAKQLKSLYDPDVYKKQLGISYFGGERDQPLVHRVMFRPTLNICGFQSGSVRDQARTIIPREAIVELDIRLVPYQTPEKIEKLVRAHLDKLKQRSEKWAAILDRCKLSFDGSFYPMYTPLDTPWTKILEESLREGFSQEPIKIPLAGGSLPLYSLYEVVEKPLYVLPYAQPDENNHAPNENMMVDWFVKGVRTSIILLEKLGKSQ
ncbi:MAG: M20/M25/M40 family metallo-hydrolase [Promethearchaeota archaeon]